MEKKYCIVELTTKGETILWIRVLTGRSAYDALAQLKLRFPSKKLLIEVKS